MEQEDHRGRLGACFTVEDLDAVGECCIHLNRCFQLPVA